MRQSIVYTIAYWLEKKDGASSAYLIGTKIAYNRSKLRQFRLDMRHQNKPDVRAICNIVRAQLPGRQCLPDGDIHQRTDAQWSENEPYGATDCGKPLAQWQGLQRTQPSGDEPAIRQYCDREK